jgi:hypothetical protein
MDSGLCDIVYIGRDSWDLLDLTMESAVNFSMYFLLGKIHGIDTIDKDYRFTHGHVALI